MNFYSNTRPKLFNLKIDEDLSKIVCKEDLYPVVHDKITDTLIVLLKNHVKPNWILILIITIILVLLHYRYINKTEEHYEDDVDNELPWQFGQVSLIWKVFHYTLVPLGFFEKGFDAESFVERSEKNLDILCFDV